MTTEILSRIQFAYMITFHYIYPPLSIGLSLLLIFMAFMYMKTKSHEWEVQLKFWIRVFALTFALGVATGVPMQFSLGTNWARYSRFVGDVFGGILGAEGVFAFAMEAGFLGILLFGWKRVSAKIHLLSAIMVSFGAHLSGFWIVAANSWMHTPAGHVLVKGRGGQTVAQVSNWWDVVFNPSTVAQFSHVVLSAWLSGAFLVISIAAYYMLKNRHKDFAKVAMKMGLILATVSTILQLVSADRLGKVIAQYNPIKLAAFEGVFDTQEYTPAYGFGWVDMKAEKSYGLKVPGLLSFLVHSDFKTPVPGLKSFPKEEWPNVPVVFQLYHLMIGLFVVMAACVALGLYLWKKKWKGKPWMFKILIVSVAFPQIASLSGWYSACMGRQPWVVHDLLKTKEAFSATVTPMQNLISLIMFIVIYTGFFVLFLFLLDRKIKHGPTLEEDESEFRDRYEGKKA